MDFPLASWLETVPHPSRTENIPVESKLTWPVWVTRHVAARSYFVRRRSGVSVGHFLMRRQDHFPAPTCHLSARRGAAFLSPPYSPDRKCRRTGVEADAVGPHAGPGKADFKSKVMSSMRRLQRNPAKTSFFFQKPSLRHAA